MQPDPSTAVADITFVAFDFETTGLYPASDRVVEFGAVRFTLGNEQADFSELADPGRDIPDAAARVSGITTDMVRGKTAVQDVLPAFMEFLGDAVLLAHNADFDASFLRAELQRAGMGNLDNPIIDTQALAQRAFPGRKSYSLQNLVEMLHIPANTAHRARDDARQCMRLFEHCVEALAFMGDLPFADVIT